jgi:hypothetical protein
MPPVRTPLGARAAVVAEERVRRWAIAEAPRSPPSPLLDVWTFELAVRGTASPLACSCCLLMPEDADEDAARSPPVLGVSLAVSEDALADNGEAADSSLVLHWGAAARPSAPLLIASDDDDDDDDDDDGGGDGGDESMGDLEDGKEGPRLPRPARRPRRLHAPRSFACPLDPAARSWAAGGGATETTFGVVRPPPCNVGTESGRARRGGGGPPLGVPAANAGERVHALLLRLPLDGSQGNDALCAGGLAFALKTATRAWLSYDGSDASAGLRGGRFFVPTAAFAQLAGVGDGWWSSEEGGGGVLAAAEEDDGVAEQEAVAVVAVAAGSADRVLREDGGEDEGRRDAAAAAAAAAGATAAAAAAAAAAAPLSPDAAVAAAAAAAIAAFVSSAGGGSSRSRGR